MITINGKEITLETPLTVAEYLIKNNYQIARIAVEKNGEILPKAQYEATTLQDGDKLEIVSFVGGG